MILNKPPEMQSPQQIIITENGEIEEQAVCYQIYVIYYRPNDYIRSLLDLELSSQTGF